MQRCFQTGLLGESIFNISLPNQLQISNGEATVGYLCCYTGYDLGHCISAVRFTNWTYILVVNNHTHPTVMFLTPIKISLQLQPIHHMVFSSILKEFGLFFKQKDLLNALIFIFGFSLIRCIDICLFNPFHIIIVCSNHVRIAVIMR